MKFDFFSVHRYCFLAAVAILFSLLTACTDNDKSYRIGVSQCASGPWRDKVNREMLSARHLYEENVEIAIAVADDDVERQIRQIDSLAKTGIDLLVVAPGESAPLVKVISRVKNAGIPIILFDRKAETDNYTAFIGGNNKEAGKAVGEFAVTLMKQMDHRPLVLEVTGMMGSSPAKERHDGFLSAIEKQDMALEYVCEECDWSADATCEAVKRLIKGGRVPDIVFCHIDGMARGVHRAFEEMKLTDNVLVVGIDGMLDEGIAMVQQGKLAATYQYPSKGEEIVRLALNILSGRPYNRTNNLQGLMVTPENVGLVALNTKELTKQSKDLITIEDKLNNYFGLYNTQRKVIAGGIVTILLLMIAVLLIWRALIQTRRTIRERQHQNEEQALFYISPANRRLRQVFEEQKTDDGQIRSQDTIFAEMLNEAIRENMSNPNLKMEDLGQRVGLGRVQLYRKVKAITGMSPVELLRQMRLQRAYALLGSTTKTVAEIAYEVGFGTPGYFSSCFKKQYGKYPTDLRAEEGKQQ